MPSAKDVLINEIEKQMDLFQTTCGKANANIISTTTLILNNMAQTILAQYDEIMKLKGELAKSDKKPKIELPKNAGVTPPTK